MPFTQEPLFWHGLLAQWSIDWHNSPINPLIQLQMNMSPFEMQDPEFWHGLESHGSTKKIKSARSSNNFLHT